MNSKKMLRKYFSYNTGTIFNELAWKYFADCDQVLDVGCGSGRFIAMNPSKAQGIDDNPQSVQYCRVSNLQVIKGDALDLPFEKDSFTGVHCAHLIEHFYPEEAWQLLVELTRILKPGGILCLQAPLMSRHFYNDLTHIRPYPPQSIMEYLGSNWEKGQPKSFGEIQGEYELITVKWRHFQLFSGITTQALIVRLLEALAKVGIRSLKRSGYLMVIKKIK